MVLPALVFARKQESAGYNHGQICQREGEEELCMHLCVWRKGGLEFFSSGCTCDMLVEMRSNGFKFACIKVHGH